MKRSQADAALTRDAVLSAARGVFERKGFARATLEDIAAAAKVTRGAVYHHFKNKAEVYQTLLLESGRKSMTLIPDAIAEGGDFFQIITRIFTRQLLQLDADPDLRAQALFALRGDFNGDETVRKQVLDAQAHSMGMLIQAFAEAQAGGAVRADLAPRDIARAFFAMQNGLFFLSSLPGQTLVVQESAGALARVFVAGIAAPKPGD